jgi:hypothetical protein
MKTKKTVLITSGLCFIMLIFVTNGCKQKNSSSSTSKSSSSTSSSNSSSTNKDCLPGLWSATESGFTKTFSFKSDKTGIEVQSPSDTRNFTWRIKDGNPIIIYVGELTEWKLALDCDKKELTVFGLVFKK